VIRFSCPQCGKAFELPEEKAGRPVVCRHCGELSLAPASTAACRDEPQRRSPPEESAQSRGLFRGMSNRVRWGVALAAGAGAGGLLLAGDWAVPLGVCSTVVVLAILYGRATGCPVCGKWWSREEVERRLVPREGSDGEGVPFAGFLDRTTYRCAGCGHRWSVTDTQEDWWSGRGRPQQHGG
jgi:DNA-directed RNA polymerase subunit RPC12/RpoP